MEVLTLILGIVIGIMAFVIGLLAINCLCLKAENDSLYQLLQSQTDKEEIETKTYKK